MRLPDYPPWRQKTSFPASGKSDCIRVFQDAHSTSASKQRHRVIVLALLLPLSGENTSRLPLKNPYQVAEPRSSTVQLRPSIPGGTAALAANAALADVIITLKKKAARFMCFELFYRVDGHDRKGNSVILCNILANLQHGSRFMVS
jgi:hypothetical protein